MKLKYKITFSIAIALVIASWLIAAYYWDKLPNIIPIHFGINGLADGWANKSIFQVFMIPVLQSLILALFIFIYYKPQYSNIPTTMWLMALDKKHKNIAFDLIRTMHAGVSILVALIFTYITYIMNVSAIDANLGVSMVVMLTIVGLMIVWLVFWTFKIYQSNKQAIASAIKK